MKHKQGKDLGAYDSPTTMGCVASRGSASHRPQPLVFGCGAAMATARLHHTHTHTKAFLSIFMEKIMEASQTLPRIMCTTVTLVKEERVSHQSWEAAAWEGGAAVPGL